MQKHDHTQLIQTLLACALECENCASECLGEDHVQMMARCISLDRDCADICTLAARLLQRNSEVAHEFLLICEKICRICAEECEKHEHSHCQRCAEACRKCAEACHAHHTPLNQD
ncbi:MAG TPA: four-helix bundle copper-binding protein [Patescibacteria group bacterium]|nr:four-helix bundle copper-binding protein [Patescibacteria group bacterium]